MTQKQLAAKLGYTHSYISNIENGKERISENFLLKMKEVFDVVIEMPPKNIVQDSFKEYETKWKQKYLALEKEHTELMKKYIACLEESRGITDADQHPSSQDPADPDAL